MLNVSSRELYLLYVMKSFKLMILRIIARQIIRALNLTEIVPKCHTTTRKKASEHPECVCSYHVVTTEYQRIVLWLLPYVNSLCYFLEWPKVTHTIPREFPIYSFTVISNMHVTNTFSGMAIEPTYL